MSHLPPADPDAPPQSRIVEWAAVLGIVAVALGLRCSDLQWMEFKGDEAVALGIARDMLDGGGIALTGLVSSLGVPNPPVFVYWLGLVMLLTRDPVMVTGLAIALPGSIAVLSTWWVLRNRAGICLRLSAPLLMAIAPWAVLYNRKVWAQDAMPLLCVALLGSLLRVSERPRSRAVFWVPVLIALLWQIHFSATGLAFVAFVLLLFQLRRLHWTALLAGTAVAIATLGPYLVHLHETGYSDIGELMNRPRDPEGTRPRASLASVASVTARDVASISAETDLDYALGRSAGDFAEVSESGALAGVRYWGGKLAVFMLALGSALVIGRVAARAIQRRGLLGRPAAFDTVISVWMLVYGSYLWPGNVEKIYPHYFVAFYPVPFILMAIPIDRLARTGRLSARVTAGTLLAIIVLGHLATLSAFRGYIHERGGTAGDYGVAYVHKLALADWAVLSNAAIVGRRGREYGFLMETRARAGGGSGQTRIAIIDHLRRGPEMPAECVSTRRFGPLSACVLDRSDGASRPRP